MQREERAIREPQRRLLVLSESPIEQIWTLLSMWESPEIAKKLISSRAIKDNLRISDEMLNSKARALAYCIRTARENILGPTESLTLRMVANYYGCMWFASAMMVADPHTNVDLPRLERFTRFGHGLGNVSFQGGAFPDSEFVYVKEHGFFPQFIKWISPNVRMESVILRQARVEDYEDISEENKPFAMSLSDMFARIPELKDTYEYISDKLGLAFQIYHSSRNTGEDVDDAMSSGKPLPPSMPKRRRNYTWLNVRVPLDCPEEHLRANGPPLEDLSIQDYAGDRSWSGKFVHDIGTHWH